MVQLSRRGFLAGASSAATLAAAPAALEAFGADTMHVPPLRSQFKLSVITDEISQDFDHACSVASQDFGMQWVEVRDLWNKNVLALNTKEIADANQILDKYKLRVTDIASPLFKVDWPDAPLSKFSPKRDEFKAGYTFNDQDHVIEKGIELAKAFKTERVRGFDFWRLDDPAPYRKAINAKLADAADKFGKQGLIFILENEMACNTGTGAEAVKVLAAIPAENFMLNWDPGNAAALGETPYPNGFDLLPKNRIGHCHCKDTIMKAGGGYEWAPVGGGVIDWVGQFKALKAMGYDHAISLETHWRGAGSPEASSRKSWAGMKADLQAAGALSA